MAPIASQYLLDSSPLHTINSKLQLEYTSSHQEAAIRPPSAPCLITDFVHYQVKSNPDALAVHFQKIASGANIPPGSIVPVCLDPTVEFVASLLAVMISGAAYVVLDPEGSVERNRAIAHDAGANFVLTNRRYSSSFETSVEVEDLLSSPEAPRGEAKVPRSSPSDLAYLIYTSGSTGKPKGVLLSHRAASHGISQFTLNGHKRWLLFYNPVFSAAQRTVLATLAKGACICLAPRSRLATALPEVLSNLKIDALGITPSALALLSPSEVPETLRQITTVGEPLSQALVDLWAGNVSLRVSYGLSECAQLNFSRQLKQGDNPRNPGRPVDTTTAVVLEPNTARELSVDEPGELCLYGPQLASGYHRRHAETSRAFVKTTLATGVLFRTGDQAVRRADGSFEILGRIDQQVKINGQRVEPQEIGANLSAEENGRHIVCVGAKIKDQTSLVAAVVSHEEDWSALVKRLRSHAQRLFPPYMVPQYWLRYEALPTNRNGKVDFRAIRSTAESTTVDNLLGRNPIPRAGEDRMSEIALAISQVWADVLKFDHSVIRSSDSFVTLGGSSLDAITAIRELRTHGIHLELADMLRSQTLEDVADSSRLETKNTERPLPQALSLIPEDDFKREMLADRGVSDALPVTALQEGILASTLQGNQDYLYQRVFDIRHLDLVRLQLAFQVVFWRSEVLHSTFAVGTNGFVQVVRNDLPLIWQESSDDLHKFLKSDKERGVTLGEPFLRVTVLNSSILVVSAHHALFDFWSHSFVFDDVARLYFGKSPAVRAPWKSFIGLVRQQLDAGSAEFWKSHLGGSVPTVLNHSPVLEFSSARRTLPVQLKSAAAALQVPSSAIIYAAWALVLSSHVASHVVTFATAISGRELPLEGIETLNGPTLAMVPQTVILKPDGSLNDVVQSVNANLWDIIKHSQVGLRGALSAAGHANTTILDTMVNILVNPQGKNELTSEVFQAYGSRGAWRTEYTTLNVEESPEGWDISLTGPVEERRLDFILNQFCQAVTQIGENPRLLVRSLSLLDATELEFLLKWNDNQPTPSTLHAEFESTAQRHSSRLAINFENKKLMTYTELDEAANRMANFLSVHGIEKGDVVPLLLEKSPFMILAILALFKLGAAYVPLSPENPVERNEFIVHDVGAHVVLSEEEHSSFFTADDFSTVLIDKVRLCAYSKDKPDVQVASTDLAYILYTSGSTGQPKGVAIHHGACASAMKSIIEFEGRQDQQFNALQFSNYVFDVSLAINDMNVDHVFLTPTVARLLSPKDVPKLQSMTVGGEQLTRDVISTWAPAVTLRNGYGPTEASVLVTMKDIDENTPGGNIGKPLASVGAVILEANGDQPLPYGAIGELCFWGPQLSDGYFKKPELTAGAFFNTTFGAGRRLYRSGDLARYLPGGDIECLGRKDDQVKVNGHRIELGEIEQAILRTGEATDCILTIWKHNSTAHLVANVVFETVDQDFDFLSPDYFSEQAENLKARLNGLAHYMVPKFLIPLPFLPRLPLSDLAKYSFDKIGATGSEEIIPISTAAQKSLQDSWIEVLQLPDDNFGLEANFLSLGGDSISAINLVSRIRRKGMNITVRDVLKYPLLGPMSEHLEQEDNDASLETVTFSPPAELQDAIAAVELESSQYEYVYPSPPGQAEFLGQGARNDQFWDLMTVRSLGMNPDIAHWIDLTTQLTATNDILRTTFTTVQGKWYGVVLNDPTPVVEFYDISSESEKAQTLESIWANRFVFGKPFVRYAVFRFPNGEHQIVTKLDHGLYDGTLLRVFDAHFQAYQRGQQVEKFTSFKEFAFHIWKINQTRPTLDFWTQPEKRPIAFKVSDVTAPRINAAVVQTIQLDFEAFSRSSGVTVSTLFQSIFQIWLARHSGKNSIAFDYLYTGRNVDLEDPQSINGTCANFLPMRSEVDSQASMQDYLLKTQDDFWQYTENCTVGIEDICRANGLVRSDVANQTLFLFQPFEPATGNAANELQKWVVMAKSQVTMLQPYAVVFEVIKTADLNGYKLKFAYDDAVWTKEQIETEVELVKTMLSRAVADVTVSTGSVLQAQ
ncbi:hypothetical protein N7470_009765 [Penicillium chermesinum]|nr:hypothetical protein N7470_009765 [Penicillium chermesinum]